MACRKIDGDVFYNHHTLDGYKGSEETQILPSYLNFLNLSDAEMRVYTLIFTFHVLYDEACSFTDEYLCSRTNLGREAALDALSSLLQLGLIEQAGWHTTRTRDYAVYAISVKEADNASAMLERYRDNWEGGVSRPDESCIFVSLDRM